MHIDTFISVGENIHCTRIYKVGGLFVKETPSTRWAIHYKDEAGEQHQMPVPPEVIESKDWEAGKVKHCATAIRQGVYGNTDGQAAGRHYLQSLAKRQEAAGASYLDINVDEFSTDAEERVKLMKWTVDVVQQAVSIPISIDSSNMDILRAGLEACDTSRSRPMVNSVSLERADAIAVAAEFNAVVIASAAGEQDMPSDTEERMANMQALMPKLEASGFSPEAIHLDPLVFPISVDGSNGTKFLEAVSCARKDYGPEIHIVAGLSNISFGMPNRKLINQVFTYLAVEHGADGGIVDPMQINPKILSALDPKTEAFQLARALLLGEDEFGMNFISAAREGKLR